MQGKFVDRADVHEHIMYHVQKLRNGRSYMTRRVDAKQGDTVLFSVSMSFQLREPNEPTYFVPSPQVVNLEDFQWPYGTIFKIGLLAQLSWLLPWPPKFAASHAWLSRRPVFFGQHEYGYTIVHHNNDGVSRSHDVVLQ